MYIPFYKERINHIEREKDDIQRKPTSDKQDAVDLQFLEK